MIRRSPDPETLAALRARLVAADPAAADAIDPQEEERALARLANRLELASREEREPLRARSRAWAPTLALLTIVAVAWLGVQFAADRGARPLTSAPPAERSAAEAVTAVPAAENGAAPSASSSGDSSSRQIQFETPGGTRVIWVLDPRFAL